ncbi:MAG: type III pantothenate kinase [bacterium]
MLLAIDVGNTNITFGLFDGKKLAKRWSCPTLKLKMSNIKCQIKDVIICNVVPGLSKKLSAISYEVSGKKAHFVTAENIPGIKVKIKNKKEIGADRVVDALAAYELYGGPAIVVDFGTATTFDVVSSKGEYLGGAIAPGISLARDALYNQTAKLPKVEVRAPKSVIGKDTVSAMQSGLVYGYVAMVEGMVARLKSQIPNTKFLAPNPSHLPIRQAGPTPHPSYLKVIATGGFAPLICKYTKVVDRIDQELTLKGLKIVHDVEMAK